MRRLVASLAIVLASAVIVAAQSFQPVAQVNDDVVTAWELQQRQRMLTILNAPPEVVADSLDTLINESIQLQAAAALDIEVSEEAVQGGVEEFAARGNLSADEFLTLIGNEGVDETTIRQFVRAGLAWRDAVRERFGAEVRITEDDVARAKDEVRAEGGPEVLLSEIVLPARNELERTEAQALAQEISGIRSAAAFSSAARDYSVADSAGNGGQVGWIPLEELEGPVANAIQGLQPGQVTAPLNVPDQIALFQLRGRRDGRPGSDSVELDYAQFLIPGGRTASAVSEAARIEAQTDTCDDLYDVAGAKSRPTGTTRKPESLPTSAHSFRVSTATRSRPPLPVAATLSSSCSATEGPAASSPSRRPPSAFNSTTRNWPAAPPSGSRS